ncbi:MAG: MnhB domain-containing protein [Phycisphaeraceae bacterium]
MSSLILRTAMRLIVPLALLFGLYMALKGHNAPGGGFIGGLILALALAMYRMGFGAERLHRMMPFHPRVLVLAGLGIALLTAAMPLVWGEPLLRSIVDIPVPGVEHPVHLPSATFFDLGVLLVVVGVSIGMITRLSEELEHREERAR